MWDSAKKKAYIEFGRKLNVMDVIPLLSRQDLQLSSQHIGSIFTSAKSLNKLFIDHALEDPTRHGL